MVTKEGMAPVSRPRGIKIRNPTQRKADISRAEAEKGVREGSSVAPSQKSKSVSTRSCLFLCFSWTLVVAIIILIPLVVFLHAHPQAIKARNGTVPLRGLLSGGSPSKQALSTAFEVVAASLLLGNKSRDTAVQALAHWTPPKTRSPAGSQPDPKIKPLKSPVDVLLASGAKVVPSKAGEKAQEPEPLAKLQDRAAASDGHHLKNGSALVAGSTAVLMNASLTTSKPTSRQAGVQPPSVVAALKPVNVSDDSKRKPKEAGGGKGAKQEKRKKDKKGNRSKDGKKDKDRRRDRKKQKKEGKRPTGKPGGEAKPAAKQAQGKELAAKQAQGKELAAKQAEGEQPAAKVIEEKGQAAKQAEEKKPALKPEEAKKAAAKPAEEQKPPLKQAANIGSSPNPKPLASTAPATRTRELLESPRRSARVQEQTVARSAQAGLAGGIPGTRISTAEQARAFRKRLQCMSSQGKWEVDPTPRLLPWTSDRGNFGHCDERWQWTPGGVAFEASDQGVLNGTFKANASLWNVRPSVKYEWRVDERQCGKGQIRRFDGRAMATALLREIGSPPAPALASASPGQGPSPGTLQTSRRLLAASSRALSPAKNSSSTSNAGSHEKQGALGPQRVLVLVGDSMQHAFAQSLLDNMRMGRPKAETTILANDSLPCAVKKLSHKKMCWGMHFFAQTQPGLRLLYIRNDFLSLRETPEWTGDGKHYEVPWIPTLRLLSKGGAGMEGAEGEGQEKGQDGGRSGGRWLAPVVVLNKGLHFAHNAEFFSSLNVSMRGARAACPDCVIIFRNTPGGHKGCKGITKPLVHRQPAQGQPFSWTEISQQSRDPMTRNIVEAEGGVFMDVESATALRGDGHTGKNRRGTEDCTHYCAPGPVDFWGRLLYHILAELLGQS